MSNAAEEKQIYVLAELDRGTQVNCKELYDQLAAAGFSGRQTRGIPYHITLGSFPSEEENQVLEASAAAAERTKAFSLTFSHIGVFGGGNVLFLAPDCNRELLECKERFGSSENWTPHATLYLEDAPSVCRALPLVLERFSQFQGSVESLLVYEFFPTRFLGRFLLKAD